MINENDKIIVATSGGPDSMYLLSTLIAQQKAKKLTLIVAHVNHHTRPSCQEEQEFLQSFCQKYNLPLEILEIKTYQKKHFTEEEARKKRIAFFVQLAHKHKADYVVTAHHADDLMETIIMKLLRGSTLDAVAGMKKEEYIQDVLFKKPLLEMSKEDIMQKLTANNIPYKIDETNEQEIHLRNRIRKNIIPYLKKEQPNIFLKFIKFSEELQEQTEYITKQMDKIDRGIKKENKIDLNAFLMLDEYLQKEYLKRELKKIYQEQITKINQQTINGILNYLKNPKRKNTFLLPREIILEVNKGYFLFIPAKNQNSYKIKCRKNTLLPNGKIVAKKNKYTLKNNYEIHLNSHQITLPLYITTREPGMKMTVKNLKGSKKIKDILIDEKIPASQKDSIPIMVDAQNTVLWILGIKKSQYDLDKNEKYDIIYRYEERKKENEKNKQYKYN